MKKMILPLMALSLLLACNNRENKENIPETKPVKVSTVRVKTEKAMTTLRYSGTVEAYQNIPLAFQMAGTVKEVLVEPGDLVKKGELLATLDETDAKNMYGISLSQYQQAKDAYERLKMVHGKGSLPDIKWVEMESKLEQAQSSLNLAQNNLDKCKMYAPVNGMVGRRNIEPGMTSLSLTAAPLELVDIRQVYIKISVPENEVAKIAKGMTASFTVPALNDESFKGKVVIVSPVADLFSRTYEAKILVSNSLLQLKPGMVCDVQMGITLKKEVLMIPHQSVSKDDDNHPYVFVVDSSAHRARKQIICAGHYAGSGLEVISGLREGQLIVNEGKEKLTDHCLIDF